MAQAPFTDSPQDSKQLTVTFSGFAHGINNIQPDFDVPKDCVRGAINVDFYDSGKVRRRKGFSKKIAGSNVHSVWTDPALDYLLYVNGSTMYQARKISGVITNVKPMVTGLTIGKHVAYWHFNGDVYWSNDVTTGRIRNEVNGDWGVEVPPRLPNLAAGVAGAMYPGTYQVNVTYRDKWGEEGGCGVGAVVQLPVGGSITMTALPQPASPDVRSICIYATPADGDIFYLVAVLPVGTTSYTLTSMNGATTALKTQFLQPMLPCRLIAELFGSLYGASGPNLFFTDPLRPGQCNLNENFFTYETDISVLLGVTGNQRNYTHGLHLCADKTYFLTNPASKEPGNRILFPFGGIFNTGLYMPNGIEVTWMSPRGQVLSTIGGDAKLLTDDRHTPGIMSRGAAIIREKEGLRQIINVVRQEDKSPLEYTGA